MRERTFCTRWFTLDGSYNIGSFFQTKLVNHPRILARRRKPTHPSPLRSASATDLVNEIVPKASPGETSWGLAWHLRSRNRRFTRELTSKGMVGEHLLLYDREVTVMAEESL